MFTSEKEIVDDEIGTLPRRGAEEKRPAERGPLEREINNVHTGEKVCVLRAHAD